MSELNGASKSQKNKVDIFSMFRAYKDFTVSDGDGNEFSFVMKTMSFKETQSMLDGIQQAQIEARRKWDTEEMRTEFRHQFEKIKKAKLIDDTIEAEKPTVQSVADLAPTVGDDERKRVEEEAAAVVKWEAERRAELEALPDEDVVDVAVDRRVQDMVTFGGNVAFMDSNIAAMVLDPVERQPILSANPRHDNYIGHLTPMMRQELMKIWQGFIKEGNDKAIRRAAEAESFLSSGDSGRSSVGSLGETTNPSPNSPEPSSPSITSGSGSTT